MQVKLSTAIFSLTIGVHVTNAAEPLTTAPGQKAVIPSWDLSSSAKSGSDLKSLSSPGLDTSSWHHIKTSKCTLMGCLIEAGIYNESDLFFSTNLQKVDEKQFLVPWNYRNEFSLQPGPGKHFFLQTHGISSRADIFLNGQQVASKSEQAGSYVGRSYDITNLLGNKTNHALAVQVHPTNYYYDFALGWVDWNPWPTDNGTGIWRDVEIKQTGPVALSPLRVITKLGGDTAAETVATQPATVTLKSTARNLEQSPLTITATATVVLRTTEGGRPIPVRWNQTFTIPPLSAINITMSNTVSSPAIWWPAALGSQPLYAATLTATTATTATTNTTSNNEQISDHVSATFGFRTVTSKLNSYKDIVFSVNNHPLQIVGAGYTPNMFLRFDPKKFETELKYVLDLGFNTIRLEGKNEHPELYEIADRMGVLVMVGWECCDKWEAWSYNQDLAISPTPVWDDKEYEIAKESMRHEAEMMQSHPSVLTFLIGSDFWPDEKATTAYLDALNKTDWQVPVVGSASRRGYDQRMGPSGMKMEGPYDWVPPNYWYDVGQDGRYGSASGFGSELGAGVGTPELGSLKKFLTKEEIDDLWKAPNKDLYHMSRAGSEFTDRKIYNDALWKRYGAPTTTTSAGGGGLEDYLMKAQIMDYEATRAQFEAFGVNWSASKRPATGLIYWMLNNAWPSLHWNIWDYYMRPAGSYYGAKTGSKNLHVAYDYLGKGVWIVDKTGPSNRQTLRAPKVEVDVLDLAGKSLFAREFQVGNFSRNASNKVADLAATVSGVKDVVFVRLVLKDGTKVVDRNVYWVSKDLDVLNWGKSEWYVTPVSKYADYTALNKLAAADVGVVASKKGQGEVVVSLENKAKVVAFFVSLNLVDKDGNDVLPLTWDDNYVTLWPGEKLTLTARSVGGRKWEPTSVEVKGKNVVKSTVRVG